MKSLLSILTLLLAVGSAPAVAASCDERARALAAEAGGTIVSVQADGETCIVKLLVQAADGPPVRRTIRVAK